MRKAAFSLLGLIFLLGLLPGYAISQEVELSDIERLGKHIFFDKISRPRGAQGCISCHDPASGWTFPDESINAHEVAAFGAVRDRFGSLKTPSSAYATFSPPFFEIDPPGPAGRLVFGGNFWNGRSVGFDGEEQDGSTEVITPDIFLVGYDYSDILGPTADQALNPFPNPVEQNISEEKVCKHVKKADYAPLFEKVFGEKIKCGKKKYEVNYKRIAVALAAYQASPDVNSFTSRLDYALAEAADWWEKNGVGDRPEDPFDVINLMGGSSFLTDQEILGHDLFYANCAQVCHNGGPPGNNVTDWLNETYSNHEHFNIGTPPNPEIPGFVSDPNLKDGLLASHTNLPEDRGKVKTPTVRNVDKRPDPNFVKAYAHNGWFKSLESIVHFYNTAFLGGPFGNLGNIPYEETTAAQFGVVRCPEGVETEEEALAYNVDGANGCWPAPEFPETVFTGFGPPFNRQLTIGHLGLSADEEAAIVAYMKALTDEYTPSPPKSFDDDDDSDSDSDSDSDGDSDSD